MVTVLIITGSAIREDRYAEAFDTSRYDVEYCVNGTKAYRRTDLDRFDVVVSPTRLGDIDGSQLLHRIKREKPHLATVAILESVDDLNRAQSKDIDTLLFRDPTPETLISTIKDVQTDVRLRETKQPSTDLLSTFEYLRSNLESAHSQSEVEQVVCDAFTRTGSYPAAWVCRVESEGSQLVPSTSSGVELDSLSRVSVSDGRDDLEVATHDVAGPQKRIQIRVPLQGDRTWYGLLYLLADHEVSEEELSLLSAVGQLASQELLADATNVRSTPGSATARYTSVLSHELRNHLQIAESILEKETKEEGDWQTITDVIKRVDRLADEAEFISDQTIDPNDLSTQELRETIRTAWSHVRQRNGGLTIRESDAFVADHELLELLFENLLRNSIEHGGTDVDITAGVLHGESGFFVEDSGPGIPPEEYEQVFDWGYAPDGGTGFGLAIVHQICENHGWDIRPTENETGGARFEVTSVTKP